MSENTSSEEEEEVVHVRRVGNVFSLLQSTQENDTESSSESTESTSTSSTELVESDKNQYIKDHTDSDEEFAELERQYGSNLKIENEDIRENTSLIDANWLDPSVELKRKFSGKNHEDLRPKPFNGKLVSMRIKGWRPFSPDSTGLKMFKTDEDEFYYEADKRYVDQYSEFETLVELGDISLISAFLKKYPNNPDALLCVADASHRLGVQVEGMSSIDLYQRIIQILERLYHTNFRLGSSKLPYKFLHNRKFHLALFRYIQVLIKQGCWKTALQVSIILRSLDNEDPLDSNLFIEFLRAQCKESVVDSFNQLLTLHSSDLFIEYSKKDPWLISEMAKSLGFDKSVIVKDFLKDTIPNAAIQLRAKLFAARNAPLWKSEHHFNWFKRQVNEVDLYACESTMPICEAITLYRHATLSDLKVNFPLPSAITSAIGGNISSHDPIPPEDVEMIVEGRIGSMGHVRTLIRSFFNI